MINITTKSAKDTQGGYVEAGGGSDLQATLSAFATAACSRRMSTIGFMRNISTGTMRSLATARTPRTAGTCAPADFRVDAAGSPQNPVTLQGDVYSGTEGLPTGGTNKASGGNILDGGRTLSRG